MGADIHFFTEKRKDAESPWEMFVLTHDCEYCEGKGKFEGDCGETICPVCQGTCIGLGYRRRNYHLFAMLADVRNGVGFGGRKTSSRFEPIHPQRGLPDDMSKELATVLATRNDYNGLVYAKLWEEYGAAPGNHSPSFVTLRELMEYNLDRRVRVVDVGVMTYREAAGGWFEKYIALLSVHGEPDNVRCVFNFDC